VQSNFSVRKDEPYNRCT